MKSRTATTKKQLTPITIYWLHALQLQFNLVKSQNTRTNDEEVEKSILSVQECIKTLFLNVDVPNYRHIRYFFNIMQARVIGFRVRIPRKWTGQS